MKSDIKNPFWFNSKLEQSCARLRMIKVFDTDQCEITIRPDSVFIEEDGNVSKQQVIDIYLGDGNSHIEIDLTLKEAREFANAILDMVNELENRLDE